MVEYSLYLDDSGHPKDQPYVVAAGFVATEQQWQNFKPRWETALKKYGLGDTFHMTDFMSEKRSTLREGPNPGCTAQDNPRAYCSCVRKRGCR